ncbi:MAG: YqjF family protein, partial [Planctomycetota bacterium]
MLNFEVDPALLESRVPAGTVLDTFGGKTFVSVVGFLFLETKVLGVPIPFHRNFEEVNLRFYVRRGERRGVVFVKEIVPRFFVAAVARWVYGENYVSLPMRHRCEVGPQGGPVEYAWRTGAKWNQLSVRATGAPRKAEPGSEAEFITEHYW